MARPPRAGARILFAVLLSLLVSSRAFPAPLAPSVGRVTGLDGAADLYPAGGTGWVALALAAPLRLGDTLHTRAAARLKVLLDDGSTLSLGPNAQMRIDQHLYNPSAKTRSSLVHLFRGKLLSVVAKFTLWSDAFKVQTDTAIIGVRGTTFVVDAGAGGGGSTQVLVIEGKVVVSNPTLGATGAQVVVSGGQGTRVASGQAPQAPQAVPPQVLQQTQRDLQVQHEAPPPENAPPPAGGKSGQNEPAPPGTKEAGGVGPPPAPAAAGSALDVLGTGTVGGSAPPPSGTGTQALPPIPQQPPPAPGGTTTIDPTFHMKRP